jgi:hypothetical protein
MALTLKKYKKVLIDFFEKHLQINTVVFGNKKDFAVLENLIYPVVNISFLDSSANDRTVIDRFQITISDLQDSDNDSSEFEIVSDTSLIGYDLLNYLADEKFAFDFQVLNSVSMNNFTDEGDDLTSGVVFVINLTQQRPINPCSVPLRL